MATSGAAAATTLRLIMEKGPRSGETLNFTAGSVIRIGRVVRGNTLTIKEMAISTKHLIIQHTEDAKTGVSKWTITDLESSNGTIVNSKEIEALVPVELRDGDEVKIGEVTAIRVRFVEVEKGGESVVRRNPRRKPPLPRKPGGGGKVETEANGSVGDENVAVEKRNGNGRGRRGRGSVKGNGSSVVDDAAGGGGEEELQDAGKRGGRRGRSSGSCRDMVVSKEGVDDVNKVMDVAPLDVDGRTNGRDDVDGKSARGGRGGKRKTTRKNNSEDFGVEEGNGMESGVSVGGVENVQGCEDDANEVTMNRKMRELYAVSETDKGVVERLKPVEGSSEQQEGACEVPKEIDLDKMTMREWFNLLEVVFAKQIRAVTDEVIADVRRAAAEVQDRINSKNKSPS